MSTEPKRPKTAGRRGPKSVSNNESITMRTIAEIAGVSAMTVSRALKSEASISRETRERVLTAVRRVGYVPDLNARVFASRRSGFVAALVPSLNNSNFAETVRGMSEIFDPAGLQMLLGDTEYSFAREESLLSAFLQRRPEAIILTGGVHTTRSRQLLLRAGIPTVEIWELPKKPLGHVVGVSNREAGASLVRYLHSRKRKGIGFIGSGGSGDARGHERRLGYQQAVHELGLPKGRVVLVGEPSASMSHGAEALDLMLLQWPDTDAIVCVSDLSAFGVLAECQRRGIAIPETLALAGFGDFEVARCCHPRLTTIAIDCSDIGRRAAEIVLDSLEERKRGVLVATKSRIVGFHVVERETA
jgi:LacI family transcriptional regulator, gluconate utilization system Gnt-I transcriptional repressor